MHTLTRILLTVVTVLAFGLGGILFLEASFLLPHPSAVAQGASQTPKTSFPGTSLLSRLSLLPSQEITAVGVIIENHQAARPYQRGLSQALVVQEFLVEGMISRFIAVFDARRLPSTIGPVRSLRPYFVDAGFPWTTLFVFAGGSPEAFERVRSDERLTALNGLGLPKSFHRDSTVEAPHNLFIDRQDLLDLLPRPSQTTFWPPFKTVTKMTGGESAQSIVIDFHNPAHEIRYTYDSAKRRYRRANGAVEDQAFPENVAVLEVPITEVGEKGRLSIPVNGQGPLLFFRSGVMKRGFWLKSEESGFSFIDEQGKSLPLGKGQLWMTVLPTLDRVTWGEEN